MLPDGFGNGVIHIGKEGLSEQCARKGRVYKAL